MDNGHQPGQCDFWRFTCSSRLTHAVILALLNDNYHLLVQPDSFERKTFCGAIKVSHVLSPDEWIQHGTSRGSLIIHVVAMHLWLLIKFRFVVAGTAVGWVFPVISIVFFKLVSSIYGVFLFVPFTAALLSLSWLVFPRRDFAENHIELLNYSTLMTCTELTVL